LGLVSTAHTRSSKPLKTKSFFNRAAVFDKKGGGKACLM
jgi:hypothetical protein